MGLINKIIIRLQKNTKIKNIIRLKYIKLMIKLLIKKKLIQMLSNNENATNKTKNSKINLRVNWKASKNKI